MSDQKIPNSLPRVVPNYHAREAAHLRALASSTTTHPLKDRLLREAEAHEELARDPAEQA